MAPVPPAPPYQFTRCPGCETVFRVTAEQLAIRAGQVRCGQCKTVFDGNASLVSLAPVAPEAAERVDEMALGPPTVTLRDAQALEAPPAPAPSAAPVTPAPSVAPVSPAPSVAPVVPAPSVAPVVSVPSVAPASVSAGMLGAPAGEAATAIAYGDRFAHAGRASSRVMGAVYAIAAPLLVVLLGAQAIFHFSSAIANRWPGTAPALSEFCEVAGCAVRPPRDADMRYLAIEASDLHADPAHKGLLTLTATIRNRAGWALAYPHLELTLTDAQDQVVVRRALAPADYAGGTVELANGIGANGEIAIKLFIDASATVQAGYRLYLFYP